MDHRARVDTFLSFLAVGDVEQVLALTTDDIVYQLYVSQTALPYGGEWRGHEAVRTVFFDALAVFDCTEYEPSVLDVHDGRARIQTRYVYRHRGSGEWLAGSSRLVLTIRDDLIARMDEYYDEPLLEAFARFAASRVLEHVHGKA